MFTDVSEEPDASIFRYKIKLSQVSGKRDSRTRSLERTKRTKEDGKDLGEYGSL
jgi:hypothetical protein